MNSPSQSSSGQSPEPARKVVALRYDDKRDGAPKVVARGRGLIADNILKAAREHDVPVREDTDLLELLSVCDLGQEIPSELYSAVAELLSYLWKLNEELRPGASEDGEAMDRKASREAEPTKSETP